MSSFQSHEEHNPQVHNMVMYITTQVLRLLKQKEVATVTADKLLNMKSCGRAQHKIQ